MASSPAGVTPTFSVDTFFFVFIYFFPFIILRDCAGEVRKKIPEWEEYSEQRRSLRGDLVTEIR
jgi:hypothetical protein